MRKNAHGVHAAAHQPDIDLWQAEDRRVGSNNDVAAGDQSQASAMRNR